MVRSPKSFRRLAAAAILGLGATRREAVVLEDDRIVARDRMTLSLTFDHAAVDGAPAAAFLRDMVEAIENPAPYLLMS
jgi:pyruvate dehydrogenase E2 component (dihydrolipoamide acetyltransferase)